MPSFFTVVLTLFFAIDAFGIIPDYLHIFRHIDRKKRLMITLRELTIALGIMVIFHYFGKILFTLLGLTQTTVEIAGGIVLFLISIRLIFSNEESTPGKMWGEIAKPPFVVPIATPLIAGPSLLAVIMIYSSTLLSDSTLLAAILLAWAASSLILLSSRQLFRLLGDKGILALQRLTGLIVALIAVQMFLQGIKAFIEPLIHGS